MSRNILIYAKARTPRLEYLVDTLLGRFMGLEVHLTTDADHFRHHQNAKLAYATPLTRGHPLDEPGGVLVPACELLFEEDIEPQYVRTTDWHGLPTLFPMDGDCMSVPFDLFAAAFYMLSCYEEYLPFEPDRHGRFSAEASALYENDFMERPLVDRWARELEGLLSAHFPELEIQQPAYQFLPTIDIDQAYAYMGKPLWRNAAGLLADILRLDTAAFGERLAVLVQAREDPYNTYRRLHYLAERAQAYPLYFLQVANHHANDHALPLAHPLQQKVIHFLQQQGYTLGLHPSYNCMAQPGLMNKEKHALEEVLDHEVNDVRMHFLRFRLPHTLREMIDCGFRRDYSLGYADGPGWRAGTCRSHCWFDLEANHTTSLERVPFYTMDRTMRHYTRWAPEDSIAPNLQAINEVRHLGGVFSFIWHNSSANRDSFTWKEWQTVLETLMQEGARTDTQLAPGPTPP